MVPNHYSYVLSMQSSIIKRSRPDKLEQATGEGGVIAVGGTNLNDRRTSGNRVVRDRRVAPGDDNISLACEASGNRDRKAPIDWGSRDEGRPSHGNEGRIDLGTVLGFEDVTLWKCQQLVEL